MFSLHKSVNVEVKVSNAIKYYGLVVTFFTLLVIIDSFMGIVVFSIYHEPLSILKQELWASVFLGVALFGWFSFAIRMLLEPWLGIPLIILFLRIKFKNVKIMLLVLSLMRACFLTINTLIFSFWKDFTVFIEVEDGVINPLVYTTIIASLLSPWILYILGGRKMYEYLIMRR